MPALRNERHERFAQEIAKGKNGADAYLAAGYALARAAASRNAYRLRNRQDVAARIDELSAKARGRIAAEQIAEGIRRGAPTLYRPELAELSRRLALLGATDQEMADALGIDQVTLDYDQARPPAAKPDHPRIGIGRLRAQQIGARAVDQQTSQIPVTALGDAAKACFATGRVLPRRQT